MRQASRYTLPHYERGLVLEGLGRPDEAAEQYRLYLVKAAPRASPVAAARDRLARLESSAPN